MIICYALSGESPDKELTVMNIHLYIFRIESWQRYLQKVSMFYFSDVGSGLGKQSLTGKSTKEALRLIVILMICSG